MDNISNLVAHNDDSEKSIISICLTPSFTANAGLVYAVKHLKPEYFYNRKYSECFRAIMDMINGTYGAPVAVPNPFIFADYVKNNAARYESLSNGMETDILSFVIEITENTTYSENMAYYAAQVIDLFKQRERGRIAELIKNPETDEKERAKLADELTELEFLGNERYDYFFTHSTYATTSAALRKQGEGLKTGYKLSKKQRDGKPIDREFVIPPNQVTIIAAPTGHGKSTFCYNLALRLIEKNKRDDGKPVKVLYLSYEESTPNIEPKIINVIAGLNLAEDNRTAIAHDIARDEKGAFIESQGNKYYFEDAIGRDKLSNSGNGESNFIGTKRLRNLYIAAVNKYYELIETDTLTVKSCNLDSTELCSVIREYKKRGLVDVAIVDYIQLLEKNSSKAHGRNRPDELKEICADLRKLANDEEYGLPIIAASQFNREVTKDSDPRKMDKSYLGESANIEHSANIILGLWNCQETNIEKYMATDRDGNLTGKLNADGERLLQYLNIKHINEPFIFARLLKSRDGVNGLKMTLNYYGNCGRIENTTDETPNQRAGLNRDEIIMEPHNTLFPAMMRDSRKSGRDQANEDNLKPLSPDTPF